MKSLLLFIETSILLQQLFITFLVPVEIWTTSAFGVMTPFIEHRSCCTDVGIGSLSFSFSLQMSGNGIAQSYTWHEEAFELEVSVKVPKTTRAKDIQFKATPTSIDLRLLKPQLTSTQSDTTDISEEGNRKEEDSSSFVTLLDPSRPLRGRVSLEGTFWEISDPSPRSSSSKGSENQEEKEEEHRLVTVTIEKQIRSAKDDFDVIDYDWKGLYQTEEENEISYRKYDEPEELNVREYAATLGVDIDNINMSLVDKSMFTSGLMNEDDSDDKDKNNSTKVSTVSDAAKQAAIESLKDIGLMQEVTKQGDGSEWISDKDGDRVPFNPYGTTPSSSSPSSSSPQPSIPFLDTDSPWHKAVKVKTNEDEGIVEADIEDMDEAILKEIKELNKQRNEENNDNVGAIMSLQQEQQQQQPPPPSQDAKEKEKLIKEQQIQRASDPIETLTVARLKEILKGQGLKVSGNKKELQERLRAQVQSMMMAQPQQEGDDNQDD